MMMVLSDLRNFFALSLFKIYWQNIMQIFLRLFENFSIFGIYFYELLYEIISHMYVCMYECVKFFLELC